MNTNFIPITMDAFDVRAILGFLLSYQRTIDDSTSNGVSENNICCDTIDQVRKALIPVYKAEFDVALAEYLKAVDMYHDGILYHTELEKYLTRLEYTREQVRKVGRL
jgi:delta-aminolevulinic acid dehydratase/porphobilinogen synthase